MRTLSAKNLINRYIEFIAAGFSVTVLDEGVEVIHTPFLLPNNDFLSVGLSNGPDGDPEKLSLSDFGCVSDFFFGEGRSIEKEDMLKRWASEIAARLDIELSSSELSTVCQADDAHVSLYLLLQAIAGVTHLVHAKQSRKPGDFLSELKGWVSESLPEDLPFETDHRIQIGIGRDVGMKPVEIEIDAAVLHPTPKFIQGATSGPSAFRVAAIYQSLSKHGLDYNGAIVYNEAGSGWSDFYRGIAEDSPADIVLPYSAKDDLLEWAVEEKKSPELE